MFIVVVFPHPDGPSSATNEPSGIVRSRSPTATREPKRFDRCSSLISALSV
jgi:hypothetical protein